MSLFHWHRWRLIGARADKRPYMNMTNLLWHCDKCAELKSTVIDGEWTIQDFAEARP